MTSTLWEYGSLMVFHYDWFSFCLLLLIAFNHHLFTLNVLTSSTFCRQFNLRLPLFILPSGFYMRIIIFITFARSSNAVTYQRTIIVYVIFFIFTYSFYQISQFHSYVSFNRLLQVITDKLGGPTLSSGEQSAEVSSEARGEHGRRTLKHTNTQAFYRLSVSIPSTTWKPRNRIYYCWSQVKPQCSSCIS